MALDSILEHVEGRRKSVVYYAQTEGDLADRFDTRNVDVEHRPLPASGPDPFVTIRSDGRVRGTITLDALEEYIRLPRLDRRAVSRSPEEHRAIFELLDDTVFASLNRHQLLLTSREFEDRAWRVGRGTLHVGFQTPARFRDQQTLYRRMAEETDLDIHVYAVAEDTDDDAGTASPDADTASPDADTEDMISAPNLTFHTEPADEIGRYWFMVYDGGHTDDQQFALVAEQRTTDSFYGVWTYDPELVECALSETPIAADGSESEPSDATR